MFARAESSSASGYDQTGPAGRAESGSRVGDRLLALRAFLDQFLTAEDAKSLLLGSGGEVPTRWAKLVPLFFDSIRS